MSAERNNRVTRAQSGDHGGFAAHSNKVDGPKAHGRGAAVEDPNTGLAAIIEYGPQRHLNFRLARLAGQANGYSRAKRCCRGLTVEHITGLKGTGLSIGGVRELSEMRHIATPIASIHAGLGHRADRRPDFFRKRNHRFAGAGMGKPNHGLAGRDDLPGLAECFDHCSIRVRH